MIDATTEYATEIVYGDKKKFACKWEILACERHLFDLKRIGQPEFPYVFDLTRAERIFFWFAQCNHVRGPLAGKPIELDAWQKFDLGCIFGWVNKDKGKRRFKTAYIRVARGNTKSTMMSGIALYGLSADALYAPPVEGQRPGPSVYEMRPEVVCGAVDKEQATIVWGDAQQMALASPEIIKHLLVQKTKISHLTRGGILRKLSKDTKNKDGGAPCIIIIDEYHAHQTSLVKDITSSGKGKRSQCLEFIITTAGEDAENKPCKIEDDIVKKILSGEIKNDHYFGIIREIDDGDDPHDENVWIKANPILQNLNSYSNEILETIRSEHALAFGSGDNSKIRQWMIKRVNRWQTEYEEKYFAGCMDKWKALAVTRQKFNELVYGLECYIGIDMSKCDDLTADAHVFWLRDGRLAVTAYGFMPENTATKHEHGDRVPYKDWARDGWCLLTPGDVTDDKYIKQHIYDMELDQKWKPREICYDPYNCRQIKNDLEEKGYICVEVRQGVQTLSEPTKRFREYVLQGRVVHDGSPLLTWCISNALEVIDNNGNIKLSKKYKNHTQRIDLIAAVINAMTRAIVQENSESIYSTRGLVSMGD
jgi:phage terminase large subunit-like protein